MEKITKKIMFISLSLIMVFVVGISCVSGYICITQEDNPAVQDFKTKLNIMALKSDIDSGITKEGLELKLKYFNPCNINE